MLVNLAEILKDTRQKGYAVGLFNCVTLEMTRGILLAAEALQSPVIIGPAESLLPGAPLEDYADMMRGMAARARRHAAHHVRVVLQRRAGQQALRRADDHGALQRLRRQQDAARHLERDAVEQTHGVALLPRVLQDLRKVYQHGSPSLSPVFYK